MTSRDMADAHETARARDERASTVTYEVHMCTEGDADFDHVINCPALHTLRTRTHAINPDTGEFTRLDQESDTMTEPQTKTEWLADIAVESHRTNELLTEIRDRLPEVHELLPVDDGEVCEHFTTRSLNADGKCVECAEPADITEEPCKRGCDRDDLGMAHSAGMTCCDTCGTERPLNSICPACEPAPADDLPGEPVEPGDLRAGDRVAYTYRWKRYEGALVVTTMRRQPITTLEHAGLLVTFEGRWAGGISDVRLIELAPADVDPDEGQPLWRLQSRLRGATRYIEKLEADLARVTKERDRLTHLLGSHADGHRCTCEMIDPGKPGIEPPTWEQDPWCLTHPDMAVIVAEVKALKAKADRYDALRADVEGDRKGWGRAGSDSFTGRFIAHAMGCILARDDERAES